MPTILVMLGWRFFFYSNERNEPVHVHCQKGGAEAKYWLDVEAFDLVEAFGYGMSPADRKIVRKIIFENFEYIVSQWNEFREKRDDG
jgi:hypothetical protein